MFIHTFNTWLVALLLHPFAFILYFFLYNSDEMCGGYGIFLFIIIPIVFFISIPSLLIAWALLSLLTKVTFSAIEKLFIWIILVELSVFLNFSGLLLILDGQIWMSAYGLMIPSLVAAFMAILFRSKQFFAFQLNSKSIKNENNMV